MNQALDEISLALNHLDDIEDGALRIDFHARLRDIRNLLAVLEGEIADVVEGPAARNATAPH